MFITAFAALMCLGFLPAKVAPKPMPEITAKAEVGVADDVTTLIATI